MGNVHVGLTTCRSAANATVASNCTMAARSRGRSPRRRGTRSTYERAGVAFVRCNGLMGRSLKEGLTGHSLRQIVSVREQLSHPRGDSVRVDGR